MTIGELIEKLQQYPKDWIIEYHDADCGGSLPIGAVIEKKDWQCIILDSY